MSDKLNQSIVTSANAIDLATRIILRVAGTNSASTLDGTPMSVVSISALVGAKLQRKVLKRVGASNA